MAKRRRFTASLKHILELSGEKAELCRRHNLVKTREAAVP